MVRTRLALLEVRWHGRGGQGVVTASAMLADAALEEDLYFQAFPEYGAERSGAPVTAYSRLSESPISVRSQITEPDVVVVVDPTLLGKVDVTRGLKPEGILLINTTLSPAEVRKRLNVQGGRVFTVDATGIARATVGRPIPNTPMLGALLRITGVVSKDAALRAVRGRLGTRLSPDVIQANILAFEQAYAGIQEG
ncbi:MAG: 2-oxoacid:acceptor oxidoreductase family protein [Dehalococcoidia bacterium]|nr:2-oxoacid:acceptor oxidoreductase family protein [Dehalococcoidia bacterium]